VNLEQTLKKNRSISTFLGRTASSMKDLFKDTTSSKRSLSISTELKHKNPFLVARMVI
jgi:hypothetical protein